MKDETTIGLEVHLQLKTRTKAFCGCSTEFGAEPNSQTCPVCLGLPGALPVFNKTALEYAIKVALVLNCKVQERAKFDRKNYFYPDLPKAYQISQFGLPLSRDGFLDIHLDGNAKRVGILRVHIEEDAGKLIHKKEASFVDFNRAGVPLLEIVSNPDINSAQEAYEYLTTLKNIIAYLGVSDCDMEKGSLRCDANISVREKGEAELGVKVELKNMNSFKAVKAALEFEAKRQRELLGSGGVVVHETRLWDEKAQETALMRSKEKAHDYRYFPDPDLTPFITDAGKIDEIRSTIPELPLQRAGRLSREYGLSDYDAGLICSSKEFADITEERIKHYPGEDKKPIVNWSIGPLLSEANNLGCAPAEVRIPGGEDELINLVKFMQEGRISNLTAKAVFSESIASGTPASEILEKKNLFQVSDLESLDKFIEEVIAENSRSVLDYKSGKDNALMFLVGQTMRKSQGKANPKVVQEILKRRLADA